ncbi:hypothetical protein LDL79_02795 [Leeuwenhoekiella palythoae]|uniref:hypothetical protein n=1 Tax=Leeuwenhoekiella TaxID=283735 RepID=UPI00142F9CB5|nr:MULTISPECIES: hypothetical protein [Leeuwenhoekiella]UBZ11055.1 hypothetical protein LDL79_02795 [Leeuwenhoekiella palythoae]
MGVLLFLGKLNKTNYSKEYIFQQILHIAIAQAIIALLLQAIPTGIGAILKRPTLGDVVVGTTGDPTDLSILMIFSVLPFLIDFKRGNLKIIIILVFFIVMMVLNDSKTHLYALLLVSICTWLINRFFINKSLITKSLFIVSAATLSVFALNYVSDFTQRVESKYGDYISGRYDAKSRYYQYTFSLDTRPFTQYVFGTGPGTNGTRAANALAYDVMYKKDNTVQLPGFIPPSSSRFTKDYISGLFTEEYAESSNFRSAVLGNPFNSICALFVEFGIVGFFLFFLFLFQCIKNSIQLKNNTLSKIILFSVLTNIVVSFLDQTFETPMPMHFMYFFIGLGLTEKHFSDAFSRL